MMEQAKNSMELEKLDNKLRNSDCIAGMSKIPAGTIDLAFADPPFNIGYKYDVYEDKLAADRYLDWTRQWGAALVRTLKPNGTFWLAIGDDFAAELKLIFQRELGLCCRSWVIWYYTFGVNCKQKFSRSHTHLFHFVRDPKDFTFNADDIRVPSARQLVYADSRADSRGRLPDDTWILILRPQDVPEAFQPHEDTWHIPRVCGTFKERAGWHGCQMPEQLLGRIIKACSNPGERVLDPFGGSGTTLVVAKKLGRKFIGFELSKNYADQIQARLETASPGEPLSGPENPKLAAPPTRAGKKIGDVVRRTRKENPTHRPLSNKQSAAQSNASDLDRAITEAFLATRHNFPVDRVIADPELNEQFVAKCGELGLPGKPFDWNHRLMNLRKAGNLKGLPPSLRTRIPIEHKDADRYRFACEIASQRFVEDSGTTLDDVLCDPVIAAGFDRYVLTMLPDKPPSLVIRWIALQLRKMNSKYRGPLIKMPRNSENPFNMNLAEVPASPGLYWLYSEKAHLYVGETCNLNERFKVQFGHKKFDFRKTPLDDLVLTFKTVNASIGKLRAQQSLWISKWRPELNYSLLAAPQ